MTDPEIQQAAENISLLVDALEKIERGCICPFAVHGERFRCNEGPCPACLAHEALETFRGR